MPRIEEFLAELRVAGVTITGEEEICRRVRREVTWPALLADLASAGRKDGITFTRSGADGPTDTQLQNILRGYAFSAPNLNASCRTWCGRDEHPADELLDSVVTQS